MRFTKIKAGEKGVELAWTVTTPTGTEAVQFTSVDKPLPAFTKSLQAFRDFVNELIGAPEHWLEEITVSTLSLSETTDGRRGLIVTATRKIDAASGRPLVINTPLMNEEGENTSPNASGIFDESIGKLIAAAEIQAELYHDGEREQIELLDKAEGAAPDKPKKKRPKGKKLGDGQFVEETAPQGVPLTDDVLRSKLLNVGRDVPIDALARWTASEREAAAAWSDSQASGTSSLLPPLCVQRDGTPSLLEDVAARAD